jgi:hypothetical protein
MSQANSPNTPILSRRAALAGIASAAALPVAAGIPTTASATADPIFAAIEDYRQADAACVTVNGDIPDEVGDRWSEASWVVMRTLPTTPAGLAALTSWARERADWLRANGTEARDSFCTVSATIDDATRGMSGLKPWTPPVTQPAAGLNENNPSDPIFGIIEKHRAAI